MNLGELEWTEQIMLFFPLFSEGSVVEPYWLPYSENATHYDNGPNFPLVI